MLRWAPALALFAAPALAQGEPEEGRDTVPPFALEGRIARGERDAPAVFARLRDPGVLEVKAGETWQEVTLRGLEDFLAKARDGDHAAQLAIGSPASKTSAGATRPRGSSSRSPSSRRSRGSTSSGW